MNSGWFAFFREATFLFETLTKEDTWKDLIENDNKWYHQMVHCQTVPLQV